MQDRAATRNRFAPPEERRRQLIEAALQVVAERELLGTKVSEVTKRAGLSVGTVNQHFQSKEELMTATLAYLADELQARWYPFFLDDELSPAEKLGAIVDQLYDSTVCSSDKIAVWFAFFGDAHYRQVYRDMVKSFDHERTSALLKISSVLKEEGGSAEADPTVIAQSVESLADGLWLALLLYPERITREAARQQTRASLAMHFPRHFGNPNGDCARAYLNDRSLGMQ